MDGNNEQLLNEYEISLFEALKGNKKSDVIKIIQEEESRIEEGKSSRIRQNAQDSDGNTFCHHASESRVTDIIDGVLFSIINFTYDMPNQFGQLPVDLSWNSRFKNELPIRQYLDAEQASYQKELLQLVANEKQIGGFLRGIVFTNNFTLTYSSRKSEEKTCEVTDQSTFGDYAIHDRQAIDEAVIVNQWPLSENDTWLEFPRSLTSENYLLVNIGFVIGVESYSQKSIIKRHFYSVPLFLSNNFQTGVSLGYKRETSGHSEKNLYDILLYQPSLLKIINYFKKVFDIQNNDLRKLYACVLDIHSSQDMCDDCELQTYNFEDDFPLVLKDVAADANVLLSKYFRTCVRASSSRSPSNNKYREAMHRRQLTPGRYQGFFARNNMHEHPMDLKKSEKFMMHYNNNARQAKGADWYKKPNLFNVSIKNIPQRTLFCVGKGMTPWENLNFPTDYDINDDSQLPRLLK